MGIAVPPPPPAGTAADIPVLRAFIAREPAGSMSESVNKFYKLLDSFEKLSGYPILINTSFNIRGEPIVCTPEEAYVCFMRCNMDYLVLGNLILEKKKEPEWKEGNSWKSIIKSD